ncbi:hypothetical protein CWO91_29865 [Bradyrhizobium genosp. SA-3]|nr:hypothetical protein CWO91_29865 [Bradyrhizobium genosp. SA-3]
MSGDLASTRRGAAVFLDNLEDIALAIGRHNWVARWTNIGDAHFVLSEKNFKKGALAEATDAWLCALTAFEVARRLVDEDDPKSEEILAKVDASIQRFGLSLEQKVEQVLIASDQSEFFAYYFSPVGRHPSAPAVICISREEETGAALLGRLLPAVISRGFAVLVVSHEEVSAQWRGQSELALSSCLDYLSGQPGVDGARIGIYGEGLSAALATDFAISDRRVAAAVCDGGLWDWARTLASVGRKTKPADVLDESVLAARRSRLARKLRCPVLVVAGGRGTVSVSEAIKLQTDCRAARVDLELAMPRMTRTSIGEIENFVSSDDYIFGWLEHKLATAQ